MPTPTSRSPASCTSCSAATTSATSSPWPRSTSTRPRSAPTCPRRSSPARTTRSASPRSADLGVTVQRGPTLDGLGRYYREVVEESPGRPVDVAEALRDARADVLVSYLPVGSEEAQRHYAAGGAGSRVAFVNAIPVFIASDPDWARRFRDAGVPIIGDDIKSQVGSTIVHRILTRLFEDRGRRPRPHLPAERRRQHGLPQHARARPPRVEEDLEDPGRDQPDRARPAARRRRPHRPVGPRALARPTASGPTSGWRGATSATCPSTSSSSWRCGTRPTPPG